MILVHLWDNCWDKWDKHMKPHKMLDISTIQKAMAIPRKKPNCGWFSVAVSCCSRTRCMDIMVHIPT